MIYVSQSPLILKDTNITNNMASSKVDGGIIYAFGSRVDFNGSTNSVTIVLHLEELSVPYRVKYTLTQKELSLPTTQLPTEEEYF